MKKYLTNTIAITGTIVLLVIFSLFLTLKTHESHWFQRFGSLQIVAGTILSLRRLIRLGVSGSIEYESTIDGGDYDLPNQAIESEKQHRKDVEALTVGLVMIAIGTIVSAFGDLPFRLFWCD